LAPYKSFTYLLTYFLNLSTMMTSNDLEPPKKGFLVNFLHNFVLEHAFQE